MMDEKTSMRRSLSKWKIKNIPISIEEYAGTMLASAYDNVEQRSPNADENGNSNDPIASFS